MRWLAILLVLMNFGLYFLPGYVELSNGIANTASGSLPRVASLKSAGPTDTPVEPGASEHRLSCVRLGWFESAESAERARAVVVNQPLITDSGFRIEGVERALPSWHWVLIPPQPEAVARRQFRDIQQRGIDAYLVTEGENRNAISLGLFESRESAISTLEEKKNQNLNAILVNFPRNQISYALVFEAEPELTEELVQAVAADHGNNFDFVEISPCGGVATSEKNP